MRILFLLPLIVPGFQEPAPAEAKALIARWAQRCKEVRTILADFVQERKTPLADEPVRSVGTLSYRREKEKLALTIQKPRKSVVHVDRGSYQVYRPEEKQLEQFEFEEPERGQLLFLAFNPNAEELEKSFKMKIGGRKEPETEIILEPADKKYAGIVNRIRLVLANGDDAAKITIKTLAYSDTEGEEVSLDLANILINPDLTPEAFELKLPEGVRVLKHRVKAGKGK